jgi:sigma-B regulation protein RsbU (phosphoserine phosphatase)
MLSVTLSKILSPAPVPGGILKCFIPHPPYYEIIPPALAIRELNQRFQSESDDIQYFTMVYGVMDIKNQRIRITQAGHPSPVYLPAMETRDPAPQLMGSGGFPVGMLPDMEYEEQEFGFYPGDRLFLYSDGITECSNKKGEQFSVERFVQLLEERRYLPNFQNFLANSYVTYCF